MSGPCNTCAFWQDETRDGVAVQRLAHPNGTKAHKVCTVLPVHMETPSNHHCGQHRPLEELCGGVDQRPASWGKS